mgnify:FL=1
MADRGVQWLAGLLEGEGCFTTAHGQSGTHTPMISLAMTDRDGMASAAGLMTTIGGRLMKLRQRRLPSGKSVYTTQVTGLPAVKIMHLVYPYMGERRAAKIHTVIAAWNPKKYKEAVAYRRGLDQREVITPWLFHA